MRRIVTIILTLLTAVSFAQTANPIFQGSKYYEFRNAVRIDSAFFAPRRDTVITDLSLKAEGMLTYRPQDKSMWYFNGTYWNRLSSGTSFAIDSARRSHDTLYFRYTTGGELAVKMDYYTKAESDERYVLSPSGRITASWLTAWDYCISTEVPNIASPDTKYLIVNGTAGDTILTVTGGTGMGDFTPFFVAVAFDKTGNHYNSFFVVRQSGSTYHIDRPLKYNLSSDTVKFIWDSWQGQHMTDYGYRGYADHIYDYQKNLASRDYKLYSFYPEDAGVVSPFININGATQGGFIPSTTIPQVSSISAHTISYHQIAVLRYLAQQGTLADRGVEWTVNLGKKNGFLETWVGIDKNLPGFAKVYFYLDNVLKETRIVRGGVQKLTFNYASASSGKVQIVTGDLQNTSISIGRTVWHQTDLDTISKVYTGGKILFVGDSWTQFAFNGGIFHKDGPERFRARWAADGGDPSDIINVGRGGMTSAWGKYWLKSWITTYQPKYCYIEFYINDANSSSSVGNPAITTWNFSSTDPYSAGTDVDGKVTQADWIANIKSMRDTCLKYGVIPIILMNTPTASGTQTQTQSAWFSANQRPAQYYDIETIFTSGLFADASVTAPLANLTKAVIDTAEVGVVTRGGKPTVSGTYLVEAQATNSASTVGVGLYPKTNYTGSSGSMFRIWNNTARTTTIFDVRNNGSVFATDYSAGATGFTIPPFTITSNAGVVRFSATNSTTLNYLYLADSFRNTIRARIPLTLQNYNTSGLPVSSFADKGSMAYDSLKNRPAYYDAFFWWSLAREEDMFKRWDTATVKSNFIHNSAAFFGAPQTADIYNIGNVRLDFGSDAKYDMPYRDSATGRLTRLPAGTFGYTLKAGPGGKPEWVNESGSFIRNGTSTQTGNFNINGNGVIGNTLTVAASPSFLYPLEVGTLPSAGNISAVFAGNAIGDPATAANHFVVKSQLDSVRDNINAANVVSGTLSTSHGGTGLSSLGTALQQIRVNAGATALEYFTPSAAATPTLDQVATAGNSTTSSIGIGLIGPTNTLHVSGSIRFQSGLPGIGKTWVDTTGTGVGAWRSAPFVSPGTPTFVPNGSTDDKLGTGYTVDITGSGNFFRIVITTGTSITNTGTIGEITFATPFPGDPVTVYSHTDLNAVGTTVCFSATDGTTILMANKTLLAPSTEYTFSVHTGLIQ